MYRDHIDDKVVKYVRDGLDKDHWAYDSDGPEKQVIPITHKFTFFL